MISRHPMADNARSRLIFALDVATLKEARERLPAVAPHVGLVKIGLELFTAAGPEAVRSVKESSGTGVFLDLKLHDIPTTVERAARAASALGVSMLTVHAEGGHAMLEAAARGAGTELRILAVTRLTSGLATPEEVVELARAAEDAGCGGVVCAGSEAAAVRKAVSPEFKIVCPGIRPMGAAPDDQARVVSPRSAIRAGADYIVVGRPIRDAADPAEAARAIVEEIRTSGLSAS